MESESEGICVEAAELRAALRRLQRLGGKTPGPGIWRVRDGVLEVEWKGGSEGVDASGALPVLPAHRRGAHGGARSHAGRDGYAADPPPV